MGASPLRVPPESMWPTGEFPGVQPAQPAIEVQGTPVPNESVESYQPEKKPANPVVKELNSRDLEAERRAWMAMAPAPTPRQVSSNGGPSQIYHLPLGKGKRAEVSLFGEISPADLDLLTKYLRLTARFQDKHVELPKGERRARR